MNATYLEDQKKAHTDKRETEEGWEPMDRRIARPACVMSQLALPPLDTTHQ